jgi:hypothetical protein
VSLAVLTGVPVDCWLDNPRDMVTAARLLADMKR